MHIYSSQHNQYSQDVNNGSTLGERKPYIGGDLKNAYYIAASNSTAADKAQAQQVCDGTNDQVEILAALNNYTGTTVHLMAGTYNIASLVTIPAGKTLEGAGDTTILNIAAITSGSSVANYGGLNSLKLVGTSSDQAILARRVAMYANATSNGLWISGNTYGIDCLENNITVTNYTFDNIRSTDGWAAGFHASGAAANNITLSGVTGSDSDRAIEIENGAHDISASNGTLTNISSAVEAYSFTLDAHTHTGEGNTNHVTYENWVLTNCYTITSSGIGGTDVISDVVFRNIEIHSPISSADYNNVAVFAQQTNTLTYENIDVYELGALDLKFTNSCTDVSGWDSEIVSHA